MCIEEATWVVANLAPQSYNPRKAEMDVAVEVPKVEKSAGLVGDGHTLFSHRRGCQMFRWRAHEGFLRVVLQPKLKLRGDQKRYLLVFVLD